MLRTVNHSEATEKPSLFSFCYIKTYPNMITSHFYTVLYYCLKIQTGTLTFYLLTSNMHFITGANFIW